MFSMSQPGLINQILNDIGLAGDKVTQKHTPANKILLPDPNAAPFDAIWNY